KEGLPELYVLMHEDVAERRQAEESLRDSEQRLRTIFETSPECVKVVGSKGELLDMNAAGLAMLEAGSVEEANRHTLVGFILPEYREAFRALHQKVMGGANGMLTFEIEGLRGTRRWLETHAAPMRDAEGRVSMLLGITRDITERKAAEEQRRLLESQIQHTQKLESLGVLAGGIAHDFNNLLTALLGNLNLAQFKLPPESPAHHQLHAMEKILLKASDLTHQMLAYSGKGRFVVDYHDLNRIVQEMGHLLQVSISKKVALRLHLAEGLPPIQSDLAQIQQVIMNLVTNASDAIGDAEGSIDLTTRLEQLDEDQLQQDFPGQVMAPGTFATLEVRDTGCGIPPEILPKIFDPFFSTKSSGRGLGLSAMQGILRGHGAGITIQTEVGRGATFKVFFPALTDLTAEAVAPPTAAPERTTLKGRVLVVDDEEELRHALAEALVHFGMEVVAARDGAEAVERFQADPASFDLVVMDLTMPRMDGREAFRRLRQLRPDIRVLLSSGYSEQESLQNLLQQGLAGFIHKPYRLEELKKIVAATLG
ncbi:MAG TPA: response regulator, partial [Geothrix sp.]|nr:response regulator [Geothrix sp.]